MRIRSFIAASVGIVLAATPVPLYGQKMTDLHKAAEKGSVQRIQKEIDKGAVIDVRTEWMETPLHWAVGGGHLEATKLLLSKGADPNAANKTGRTAIYMTCSLPLLQELFKAGADAGKNAHIRRMSALSDALLCKDEGSVVELLLKHGASVDQADEFGTTPLHLSAEFGSATTMDLLLKQVGDANPKNVQGLTPRDVAVVSQRKDLLEIIDRYKGVSLKYQQPAELPAARGIKGTSHGNVRQVLLKSTWDMSVGFKGTDYRFMWEGAGVLGGKRILGIGKSSIYFAEPGHSYRIDTYGEPIMRDSYGLVVDVESGKVVARLTYW